MLIIQQRLYDLQKKWIKINENINQIKILLHQNIINNLYAEIYNGNESIMKSSFFTSIRFFITLNYTENEVLH